MRKQALLTMAAAATMLGIAGCSDDAGRPGGPSGISGPRMRVAGAMSVSDSTVFLARRESARAGRAGRGTALDPVAAAKGGSANPEESAALEAAAVTVNAGDMVTITITSAECASIGDVMSVSGVVSGIVSTNACFDVGASITLGPAPGAGTLSFELNDPRFGSGTFRVSGAYPSYLVEMEDGFGDGDFNDNILSVVISPGCQPFKDPSKVTDPLLKDPFIRHVLDSLARETGWNKPLHDQAERGGFFGRNAAGDLKFFPYDNLMGQIPLGPCLSGASGQVLNDMSAQGY